MDIGKYVEKNNITETSNNKNNNFITVSISFICIFIILICSALLIYFFIILDNTSSTNNSLPVEQITTIVRPLDSVYPLANTIIISPTNPKDENFPQTSVPLYDVILTDKYGKRINKLRTYNIKVGDKYYDYGLLITATLPFYMIIIEPTIVDGITVNSYNGGEGLNLYTLYLNFSNIGNIRSLKMGNGGSNVYGFTY